MNYSQKVLIIYIFVLIMASLISFICFGIDKHKAIKGKTRIKEKHLLEITILGGSIGSILGRNIFRHKTNKKYFSLVINFSFISQLFLLIVSILMVI